MSDDIRRLSDALARDPGGLAFVPLAEALRARGDLELALRVAVRGLDRHPYLAEGHDVLARIHADRGALEEAADEWGMAASLAPDSPAARKGLAFIAFRQGRLEDALAHLSAISTERADDGVRAAVAAVRRAMADMAHGGATATPPAAVPVGAGAAPAASALAPTPDVGGQASSLFDSLEGPGHVALLLDADGLVLAGRYLDASGRDVAEAIGAELAGVSTEADRAMRHLDLGAWTAITVESNGATVAMRPAPHDGLVLLTAASETPPGLVRLLVDRALERARRWLEGLA